MSPTFCIGYKSFVPVLAAIPLASVAQSSQSCILLGMPGVPGPCPAQEAMDGEGEPRNSSAMGMVSTQTVQDITQAADGVLPAIPHSSSTLIRTKNGVSASLSTSGLLPDSANTMWWLVFNNPEQCTGGEQGSGLTCGPPDDLQDPAVEASVFGGAGQVSDLYGRAPFSAHAFVGEDNGLTLLFGPGIIDPFKAEIHLIVQDHGPAGPLADAGLLEEALRFPGVGCRPGEPNQGACAGDIQGAAHTR